LSPIKTLTQLLREAGIPDVPPDDPVCEIPYSIRLVPPSGKPTQKQLESLGTGEAPPESPRKLIDRNSKDPRGRSKFFFHLGAMLSALRAPLPMFIPRVRSAARLAMKEGVDWRDVYRLVKQSLPSYYPLPANESPCTFPPKFGDPSSASDDHISEH